ncbi:MAG: FAD-dependent monooxygenase [Lautropia sp.]
MNHTPVLIVGAGPTGLMLACQLARFGIDFVIIDRKDGPTRESRALVVQARSLELYDALGVSDEALAEGRPAEAANLYVRRRRVQRVPLSEIGRNSTAYPFVLVLEQSKNEALLLKRLEASGRSVRWRTGLEQLTQDTGHVDVELRDADGNVEALRCDWLVGCDGARSVVRQQCGLEFAGGTYQNAFYVADTGVDWDLPHGEVTVCLSRETFVLFFPMPGERRYRVIGLFPADRDGDGIEDDEPGLITSGPGGAPLTFDDIAAAVQRQMDIPVRFHDTDWFSAYRVHHRCVERFRAGRCFVAGDSAHIHSPVGAQGMNTGLQDASNLAWKLALVARGRARPALLDSYHDERWPIAQMLLRTTDTAFRFVISRSAPVREFRLRVFPWLAAHVASRPSVRRRLFRTVSQIGIRYRGSNVGANLLGATSPLTVRAGDRLPYALVDAPAAGGGPLSTHRWLRAPCFHVLLMKRSGDLAPLVRQWHDQLDANYPGWFEVHPLSDHNGGVALLDAVEVADAAVLIVRPDQYLGYVADRLDLDSVGAWIEAALQLERG